MLIFYDMTQIKCHIIEYSISTLQVVIERVTSLETVCIVLQRIIFAVCVSI